MRKPGPTPTWNTFISILSYPYWISIVATMILGSGVLFLFIWVFGITQHENKSSKIATVLSDIDAAVCINCLALGQQDVNLAHKHLDSTSSASVRTAVLVICLFGMLSYFIYNAGMISFLMVQHYEMPINMLGDILNKPEYQLLIMGNSSDESYFADTTSIMYREIWSKTKKEGGIISGYAEGGHLIKTNPKKVLFAVDSFEGVSDSYPCEVVAATKNLGMIHGAFAFNNKSSYIDLFSYHISKIKEFGLVSGTDGRKKHCHTAKDQTFRSFGYGEVFSVFVLAGIGFSIAIAYSIVEYIFHRHKSKNDVNEIPMGSYRENTIKYQE